MFNSSAIALMSASKTLRPIFKHCTQYQIERLYPYTYGMALPHFGSYWVLSG